MIISSSVVFIFTFLLFLSGYVLQQQTVRSLQAAIKPQPVLQPPPSPVLAKHFGTPPGHSLFDKYLATNRPKGGWAKVAYVQLLREHVHVCNAVMLFATLEEQESMAQRMILYPKAWDARASSQQPLDPQTETSKRLLRAAAKRYKVMLQPVEPMLKVGSSLALDTGGLDHLFTLPMETTMLGISAGSEDEATSPSVILLRPSKENFQDTLASLPSDKYDEETVLLKIPRVADLPEDQVHVVARTADLKYEDDAFNSTEFLGGTSYVHISDTGVAGPEFGVPQRLSTSAKLMKPEPRKAWQDVYERYRQQRMDVCGLDLEPAPEPA
ncbi:MAG: hypothetical protein Q9220_000360 [cf. Caloplaca sp. 1 TL-2023]